MTKTGLNYQKYQKYHLSQKPNKSEKSQNKIVKIPNPKILLEYFLEKNSQTLKIREIIIKIKIFMPKKYRLGL